MKTALTIFFTFILIGSTFGQESKTDTLYAYIKTNDGNTYIGKILRQNDNEITLFTESVGEVKVDKKQIKRKREFLSAQLVNGEYWQENPNSTRNFYGPTGFGLRKGEGYYQNFWVFLNSVSYGFSDNFTVGFGIVALPLESGINFSITPKFSFPIIEDELNMGFGVLYTHIAEESLGIGYSVATYGSRETNATFGIGYGYSNGDLADAPIMTLSGMIRVAKKLSLVSENWFIPYTESDYRFNQDTGQYELYSEKTKYNVLFSIGLRLIFESVSVDLGLVNVTDSEIPLGIPIVGIAVPFGNR